MSSNISGIYKIENKINHCIYIGKAKDIQSRQNQHKSEAKSGNKAHLYNAIRKYGIENFDFSIIEIMSLENYITNGSDREKYQIKYYNSYLDPKHYNETEGGEGVIGQKPSQEQKDKQSKIKKQQYQTEEGIKKKQQQSELMKNKNLFKGHNHTEEQCKKHSKNMKGNKNPNYNKHNNGKKCLCIELNKIFNSTREAAQYIGVAHQNIAAACRGDTKTSGGYHQKYIEE